jgi:hypothetical protein
MAELPFATGVLRVEHYMPFGHLRASDHIVFVVDACPYCERQHWHRVTGATRPRKRTLASVLRGNFRCSCADHHHHYYAVVTNKSEWEGQ